MRCAADLVRAVQPVPEGLNMDFLRASSYTGAATTGQDAVEMGLVSKIPIQGRHILLVEDIIDTGKTLQVIAPALRPDTARGRSLIQAEACLVRSDCAGQTLLKELCLEVDKHALKVCNSHEHQQHPAGDCKRANEEAPLAHVCQHCNAGAVREDAQAGRCQRERRGAAGQGCPASGGPQAGLHRL